MSAHVWQLAVPHFVLGLGLGIVDASLMPLLAKLADESYHAGYGAVYALAQTSVALAYSSGKYVCPCSLMFGFLIVSIQCSVTGPLIGGQLVPLIGFPDLIRSVGFINIMFCPFLLFLYESSEHEGGISSIPILRPQHSLLAPGMQMTVRNKLIQPDQQHQQSKTNSLYQRFYNDDLEWD